MATKYTKELADKICAKLAEGMSLRKICEDEAMPPATTVRQWVVDDREGFAAQYARARDLGLDSLAEEIIAISDTPVTGQKTVSKATGIEITEGDMIEHRRLQVDARKWYLSKVAPKKYGDKLAIGGADDLPPLKTMTDEQIEARIKALAGGSSK
jgi:hypothetical protein